MAQHRSGAQVQGALRRFAVAGKSADADTAIGQYRNALDFGDRRQADQCCRFNHAGIEHSDQGCTTGHEFGLGVLGHQCRSLVHGFREKKALQHTRS